MNRNDEFAPVKNANGAANDTPEIARKMVLDQHSAWVSKAAQKEIKNVEVDLMMTYSGDNERFRKYVQDVFKNEENDANYITDRI